MWVIVVGCSDYFDDGIGKVLGPFDDESQANNYAESTLGVPGLTEFGTDRDVKAWEVLELISTL